MWQQWQQQSHDPVGRRGSSGLVSARTRPHVPTWRGRAVKDRGGTRYAVRRGDSPRQGRLATRAWRAALGLGVVAGLVLGAVRAPQVHAAGGGWTMTGKLNVARSRHTATLLPNGKVLVYGGRTNSEVLSNSAELYDPATGNWTLTGSSVTRRIDHTASLLPNGHVLVTGGSPLSAEVYNPTTGTWYAVGNLNTNRSWHTATVLPNGKVLVVGGILGNYTLPSAELYDPVTQMWTPTNNLIQARFQHSAVLLADGKVLVVGGEYGPYYTKHAEVYDPTTGVWKYVGMLSQYRSENTTTALHNGEALVVGGVVNFQGQPYMLDDVQLFNPVTGWYTVSGLHTTRQRHTATRLLDGQVLVAGGRNWIPPNSYAYLPSAVMFDAITQTWTALGDLNLARANHTATLLPNGTVLVAGGHYHPNDPTHTTDSAELFDPADTCSPIHVSSPTALPTGRLGMAYGQTFTHMGSTGTVVWSISAGTLPSGLALNATSGMLAGTPTVSGTFPFTVQAADGNCLGERAYTLIVTGWSTTELLVSPNPAAAGQPLTLEAEVGTQNGWIPTGTVHFSMTETVSASMSSLSAVGGESLGTAPLIDGIAHLTITAPAAGSRGQSVEYILRADYSGDGHFHPSSTELVLIVDGASGPIE